jgi:hypothetical protein
VLSGAEQRGNVPKRSASREVLPTERVHVDIGQVKVGRRIEEKLVGWPFLFSATRAAGITMCAKHSELLDVWVRMIGQVTHAIPFHQGLTTEKQHGRLAT